MADIQEDRLVAADCVRAAYEQESLTAIISAYRERREQAAREARDGEWSRALWPCNPEGDPARIGPREGAEWYRERCERAAREEAEMAWRESLWRSHDPDTVGPYGDGLLCNTPMRCGGHCDFKRESIERVIAHVLESVRKAARDAVARQAFAARCYDCRRGYPATLRLSDNTWMHCEVRCGAGHLRLALDPDGRLAGAEVKL